jgi:hypothetical protein
MICWNFSVERRSRNLDAGSGPGSLRAIVGLVHDEQGPHGAAAQLGRHEPHGGVEASVLQGTTSRSAGSNHSPSAIDYDRALSRP